MLVAWGKVLDVFDHTLKKMKVATNSTTRAYRSVNSSISSRLRLRPTGADGSDRRGARPFRLLRLRRRRTTVMKPPPGC